MPVQYDSKKIIPAPFISIKKGTERTPAGQKKRIVYNITASSKIVAFKGSPTASGTFWTAGGYPPDESVLADARLAALRAKEGALCKLFCDDGKWFEIQPIDGSAPIKFQPRIQDIEFEQGQWFDTVPYTINMEADTIWFGNVACCSASGIDTNVEETWSIEQTDDNGRIYRLTHNVQATMTDKFDDVGVATPGWLKAKDLVVTKLGVDNEALVQAGVLNLAGYNAYNHARAVNQNEADGTYAVTETWLVFNPNVVVDGFGGTGIPAIEDYTVNIRTAAEDSRVTVGIEGTIQGLAIRSTGNFAFTTTKWDSASQKWSAVQPNLLVRAQTISTVLLNPQPMSTQVGKNPTTGLISYNVEYNNRCTYNIPNAQNVSVKIQNVNPADVFAEIPVLDRPAGPILQPIGSTTRRERTVTVEAKFPVGVYGQCVTAPVNTVDIAALILLYAPSAVQVFVSRDDDNWSPDTGIYSRSISFVYQ
jgi:hypothetical protein